MAANALGWLLALAGQTRGMINYSQITDDVIFSSTTSEVTVKNNLGSGVASMKYTLFGWYSFNGQVMSISNVLNFHNLVYDPTQTRPFNSYYPACAYTKSQILADQRVASSTAVLSNPNCDILLYPGVYTPGPSMLYVNYSLQNATYSLLFWLQVGVKTDATADMVLDGFSNIPLKKNLWTYFAVSADYSAGVVSLYMKAYDSTPYVLAKNSAVTFPRFLILETLECLIGSLDVGPSSSTYPGFLGTIAAVNLGLYYTSALDLLWANYLSATGVTYSGILMDIYFDLYASTDQVKSAGYIASTFSVTGDFTPLYALSQRSTGARFGSTASVVLQNLQFKNDEYFVRNYAFLFNLVLGDGLADSLVLVQRGAAGVPGYFLLSLQSNFNGYVVVFSAFGSLGTVGYTGTVTIVPNQKLIFIVGASFSTPNAVAYTYWDSLGRWEQVLAGTGFMLPAGDQPVAFLSPANIFAPGVYVDVSRMAVLETPSGGFLNNLWTTTNTTKPTCQLPTSFYALDKGCLNCAPSVAVAQSGANRCVTFCPWGYKNSNLDLCIACSKKDCAEHLSTAFQLYRFSDSHFLATPNYPLGNYQFAAAYFNVSINATAASNFTYNLTPLSNNSLWVDVSYLTSVINQRITLWLLQSNRNAPLYDSTRTPLYALSSNSTVQFACVVPPPVLLSFQVLFYIAFSLGVLSLAAVALVTALFSGQMAQPCSAWKHWVIAWTRCQLVALLPLLGVTYPCRVRAFLTLCFNFFVAWNLTFGQGVVEFNRPTPAFMDNYRGLVTGYPQELGVTAFFLSNFGVAFCVQLGLFALYLAFKAWDLSRASCDSVVYRAFAFVEFNVLIFFFFLAHFQAFAFMGLNFLYNSNAHSYFVACLVMASFYFVAAVAGTAYTLLCVLRADVYKLDPLDYTRFYFYMAGYRLRQAAFCYDPLALVLHAALGLALGTMADYYVSQTLLVTVLVALCLGLLGGLRPHSSPVVLALEAASLFCLLLALVLIFFIGVQNYYGCFNCSQTSITDDYANAIVVMLFFAMVFPFLGALADCFLQFRSQTYTEQNIDIVNHTIVEQSEYLRRENSAQMYAEQQMMAPRPMPSVQIKVEERYPAEIQVPRGGFRPGSHGPVYAPDFRPNYGASERRFIETVEQTRHDYHQRHPMQAYPGSPNSITSSVRVVYNAPPDAHPRPLSPDGLDDPRTGLTSSTAVWQAPRGDVPHRWS